MKNISFNKNYSIYLFISIIIYIICFEYSIDSGNFSLSNDYYGILRGFPADTGVYLSLSMIETFDAYHRNIGPTLVLYLFNENLFSIFIIQFMIYQLFIYKLYKINKSVLFLMLSLLPILSLTTLFPNKELYTIYVYASLILYLTNKKIIWILLAIIIAFFARYELIYFIILFIIFLIFKKYFNYILIILFLSISFYYKDVSRMDEYRLVLESGVNHENSIALFIDNLCRDYYMYFIMWPFKIMNSIIDGGYFNLITFSLLLLIVFKNYSNKSINILFILALLYGTIVSFPHFRYILPTYIIMFHIVGLHINSKK